MKYKMFGIKNNEPVEVWYEGNIIRLKHSLRNTNLVETIDTKGVIYDDVLDVYIIDQDDEFVPNLYYLLMKPQPKLDCNELTLNIVNVTDVIATDVVIHDDNGYLLSSSKITKHRWNNDFTLTMYLSSNVVNKETKTNIKVGTEVDLKAGFLRSLEFHNSIGYRSTFS